MNEAEKIIQIILVANNNSTVVLYPGKEPFDFPTSLVTPKFTSVLRFRLLWISLMWCNQLDSKFSRFFVQCIGIISFIANHLFGHLRNQSMFDCGANKSDFMGSVCARPISLFSDAARSRALEINFPNYFLTHSFKPSNSEIYC